MAAFAAYLDPLQQNAANGASEEILLRIANEGRVALRKSYEEGIQPKAKSLTKIFRTQLGVEKPPKPLVEN